MMCDGDIAKMHLRNAAVREVGLGLLWDVQQRLNA
jgi:hypothetical protein